MTHQSHLKSLGILQTACLFSLVALGQRSWGQCTDSTTVVSNLTTLSRLTGDIVRGYSEASISGNYRFFWQLYLSTWLTKDGIQLGSQLDQQSNPPALGATVSKTYSPSLSFYGPGSFNLASLTKAYTPYCGTGGTWNPPYLSGWDGNNSTGPFTVQRPAVSMDHPIWYLGGAGGSGTYQVTGVLTADPKGAPETPSWVVTSTPTATKVSLSCSTCLQAYITAQEASGGCTYDVVVKASVAGFLSDPFYIFIDRPWTFSYVNGNNESYDFADGNGYLSQMSYALKGLCGAFLTDMDGNESFPPGGLVEQDQSNNWPPGKPKGLHNVSAVWTDSVALKDCQWTLNFCYPDAMNPQSPRLANSIRRLAQEWRMGNIGIGVGARVQTDTIQLFQDHGRHITIVSPAP